MSVVAAAIYRKGERLAEVGLEDAMTTDLGQDDFVWIGLHEPGEDELRRLQERFALHPLAVEDALSSHEQPKVDAYNDQLFVVTRTARLDGEEIVYGETNIFVGPKHIITVRHGSARAHSGLRQQLESAPSLLRHGTDYVLHGVLDFIVDGYLPVVQDIEEDVLATERKALDLSLTGEDVRHIFRLRGELLRFRRVLGPMRELCARLEHQSLPGIDSEVRPYFRDVHDHVRRVETMVDGLREIITTVFEASLLLEQQHQNTITRKLAAGATLVAVPTAVAGIYGMNFKVMPELDWQYGYPFAWAFIVGLCAFIYWRFKRVGWL